MIFQLEYKIAYQFVFNNIYIYFNIFFSIHRVTNSETLNINITGKFPNKKKNST